MRFIQIKRILPGIFPASCSISVLAWPSLLQSTRPVFLRKKTSLPEMLKRCLFVCLFTKHVHVRLHIQTYKDICRAPFDQKGAIAYREDRRKKAKAKKKRKPKIWGKDDV